MFDGWWGMGMLAAVAAAQCSPMPPPEPPPVVVIEEPDGGWSTCASACVRLAELGCTEAQPTRKGTTCTQVCEDAAAEGIELAAGWQDWRTCEDVRR